MYCTFAFLHICFHHVSFQTNSGGCKVFSFLRFFLKAFLMTALDSGSGALQLLVLLSSGVCILKYLHDKHKEPHCGASVPDKNLTTLFWIKKDAISEGQHLYAGQLLVLQLESEEWCCLLHSYDFRICSLLDLCIK